MSPRTTLVLLVVALALGGFVYFYEILGSDRRAERAAMGSRLFPGIEADDVTRIDLVTSEGVDASVERRDGVWRLTKPVDFAGDEIALDGMASNLAKMEREASVQDPEGLEIYGLGQGGEVVHFVADGGDFGLRLGIETPVGANAYVTPVGSETVSIVPTWRVTSFRKSLDELRDRRVIHFDRNAVGAVEVRWKDSGVSLAQREGEWWLTAPLEVRGDDRAIDGLLSDLAFLRADGFVDDPPPDSEVGLDRPEFSVTLELAEGGQVVFALGDVYENGQRVARGDEVSLYRIPATRLAELPRTRFAYRFKSLSTFDATTASRVELTFATDASAEEALPAVTLVREGERWRGRSVALEEGVAESLIAELSRLEASAIEAEAMGPDELAALGLSPPRVSFRIWGPVVAEADDDEETETREGEPQEERAEVQLSEVHLGVLDVDRGIAAQVAGSETVYRIDAALAEQLPVNREAFDARFRAAPGPEPAGEPADDLGAPSVP